MNTRILALSLSVLGSAAVFALGDAAAAPFTYVKVIGPKGTQTTWYPGTKLAVTPPPGEAVGLRPGYRYRFELGGTRDSGNIVIWPSIEVRGSLVPRPDLNVAEHPVPIHLTEDDIERIAEGRFLTRVYYLEDPDKAINGEQPLGVPLIITAADEREALNEARGHGRVMIIVRAGERLWTPAELEGENVPGTIWAPSSMKAMPLPVAPPCLEYFPVPLFDPLLGPRELTGECLHDGGDRNQNLGIGRDSKLYGLDPSDTAMEYSTPSGRKVTTSNRVCICVPRFAARQFEAAANIHHTYRAAKSDEQTRPSKAIVQQAPPLAVALVEQPQGRIGSLKPSGMIIEQSALVKEVEIPAPAAVLTLKGAMVKAQVREAQDLTIHCDTSLTLIKRVDPPHPKQIGEVVTFYLSFRNPTTQPMTDVVISDSLTARLEYIEGSAQSTRAATFSYTPNEAGSAALRWVIDGTMLPGHNGVISFRARIR